MVSRSLSVLVALIPTVAWANAFAQVAPDATLAGLETWSVEQLCGTRDRPEALEELERREVFADRELRAIRRDLLRTGVSELALICLKGWPETIVPEALTIEGVPVDAFIYPPGAETTLVVYLSREDGASTVARIRYLEDPYAMPPSDSGRRSGSRVPYCAPLCVPQTSANSEHSRASQMSSSAPPQLPSQ